MIVGVGREKLELLLVRARNAPEQLKLPLSDGEQKNKHGGKNHAKRRNNSGRNKPDS